MERKRPLLEKQANLVEDDSLIIKMKIKIKSPMLESNERPCINYPDHTCSMSAGADHPLPGVNLIPPTFGMRIQQKEKFSKPESGQSWAPDGLKIAFWTDKKSGRNRKVALRDSEPFTDSHGVHLTSASLDTPGSGSQIRRPKNITVLQ